MIPLPSVARRRLDGPYCLAVALRWAYAAGMDLAAVIGRPATDADHVDLFAAWLGGDGGPARPVCAWDGRRNVAAELAP